VRSAEDSASSFESIVIALKHDIAAVQLEHDRKKAVANKQKEIDD
jgi:hypothetical protein